MIEKKMGTKFTILFSQTNPVHIQAVDILNRQPQRGKAHYIANAILHYENRNEMQPSMINGKSIEAVVKRMLDEMQISGADSVLVSAPAGQSDKQSLPEPKLSDDINYNDIDVDKAIDALGADGLKDVANALNSFRKK